MLGCFLCIYFIVGFFSMFLWAKVFDGRGSKNKDNNKTVIFHQYKREETVMIEHNKLAFDQRDYRLVKRST